MTANLQSSALVEYGNAGAIDTEGTGWFIGYGDWTKDARFGLRNIPRDELMSGLCVKWFNHRAGHPNGERKPISTGRTISILVSATSDFQLDFATSDEFPVSETESHMLRRTGDFVIWGPGIYHRAYARQDATVVTIRWEQPWTEKPSQDMAAGG